MLPNHRPSILHRPQGRVNTRNDENLEREYQEEQARPGGDWAAWGRRRTRHAPHHGC